MAREKITMIVGNTEDFLALDIDVTVCRKSLDGIKSLKHKEELSSVDFNSIMIDFMTNQSPFYFMGDKAIETLMETVEWKIQE